MPQFNALNGMELKKVILQQMERTLEDSGDFQQNVTYPWVKYSFELKMTSYPKFSADSEPISVAIAEDTLTDPDFMVPDEPPTLTVVSSEPVIVDTPDQARVDADLPIPTPVPVVGVGVIDRPVKQKVKAK